MAHVEAPTFGSIILAGILLKLGGVGLIRFSNCLNLSFIKYLLISYCIIFTLFVTCICSIQSDFKRLVAYSSVSHIMSIPIILISDNLLSSKVLLITIFVHGLSSPTIFMIVGLIYSIFSSRQLIFIRGIILYRPLLCFFLVLCFFLSISAPPMPSFLVEFFFLTRSLNLRSYIYILILILPFLSLIYNLI